jgi:hypothetical protein
MLVVFIVSLAVTPPMADDRVAAANWTTPWKEIQWDHPGSMLSFGSGSAIKRITAGVKAAADRRCPSFDLGPAFTLPVQSVSNEKRILLPNRGRSPTKLEHRHAPTELRMSVEQTDVVDILSIDRETGHVVLTISDHLDWSDSAGHQAILQKKLNTYLAFVESGEILEQYPKAKNRPVAFNVVFGVPPDESGWAFVARAREVIESAGFTLREEVFTGGRVQLKLAPEA